MSSTNVRSEETNNIYCAAAQIIPTERAVEIPPKAAQKGPTVLDVKLNEGIEIPLEESTLNKDGKLINKNGELVAQFSVESVKAIETKHKKQKAKTQGKEDGR